MIPSKKEQIEALLNGEAYKLVEKYVSPKDLSGNSYKEVFTVKKHEIVNYLKKNYALKEVLNQQPSNKDGFYVIPMYSSFKVYEQERGIRFIEYVTNSEQEVWELFVDYLIRTSGTGLSFT
jgi:hypothetical protein